MRKLSMLATARKRCGVSQKEIARRLDKSQKTISLWEGNPERLSVEKIKAYYDALPELEDEEAKNFFAKVLV